MATYGGVPISGREILALDDNALRRFRQENTPAAKGSVVVHLSNALGEVTPEEHRKFVRRLLKSADKSRPVDLDQVSMRLMGAIAKQVEGDDGYDGDEDDNGRESTKQRTVAGKLDTEENQRQKQRHEPQKQQKPADTLFLTMQQKLDMERAYYEDLVADGCQPWYPVELLESVLEHPECHSELLTFWVPEHREANSTRISDGGSEGLVFTRQYQRWMEFRDWQRNHRGRLDLAAAFKEHQRRQRTYLERTVGAGRVGRSRSDANGDSEKIVKCAERLPVVQGDFESEKEERMVFWTQRERERRVLRELSCPDCPDCPNGSWLARYAQAIGTRLQGYRFTMPLSFHLKEDPRQQDRLTTWVEYLNYEYWWHDVWLPHLQHYCAARRHQLLLDWVRDQVPVVQAQYEAERRARAALRAPPQRRLSSVDQRGGVGKDHDKKDSKEAVTTGKRKPGESLATKDVKATMTSTKKTKTTGGNDGVNTAVTAKPKIASSRAPESRTASQPVESVLRRSARTTARRISEASG